MKKYKLFALIVTVVLSTGIFICALGCTSPESNYYTYITDGSNSDSATSTILACSCSPRNNYLRASIRVLKMDGSEVNFTWYPSLTTYVSSTTQNSSYASKTVSYTVIREAYGSFYARCSVGTYGSEDGLTDYDYNPN